MSGPILVVVTSLRLLKHLILCLVTFSVKNAIPGFTSLQNVDLWKLYDVIVVHEPESETKVNLA